MPNYRKQNWLRRKIWLLSLVVIGLGLLFASVYRSPSSSSPTVAAPTSPSSPTTASLVKQALEYKTYTLPQAVVHTLLIPAQSSFLVTPAISEQVGSLEQFAQKHDAIAVINGGFFDPANQLSTSYVVLQGKQVADPKQNDRLMSNPDLTPYLSKILDRSEFRRYQCGETVQYAIALHSESSPTGCQLIDALGGGPRLLPTASLIQEGFLDQVNGTIIRDSLGSSQANARTAIGITQDDSILWVMAAQKPGVPSSGLSLEELAAWMKTHGVEQALNLDGGSSSSLYYSKTNNGKTIYGKLDRDGNSIKRPVKSVLMVQPKEL